MRYAAREGAAWCAAAQGFYLCRGSDVCWFLGADKGDVSALRHAPRALLMEEACHKNPGPCQGRRSQRGEVR
jgi:hypothetical protein